MKCGTMPSTCNFFTFFFVAQVAMAEMPSPLNPLPPLPPPVGSKCLMHALHHSLQYQLTISVTIAVYTFMQYAVPWSWMIPCMLLAMTVYVMTATER